MKGREEGAEEGAEAEEGGRGREGGGGGRGGGEGGGDVQGWDVGERGEDGGVGGVCVAVGVAGEFDVVGVFFRTFGRRWGSGGRGGR